MGFSFGKIRDYDLSGNVGNRIGVYIGSVRDMKDNTTSFLDSDTNISSNGNETRSVRFCHVANSGESG